MANRHAANGRDVDAALEFVKDAASVSYGLWLSYLGILTYIAVAAGAVTDEDLFLERPVRLPLVSESALPLVIFFVLAPVVFVIWHAYTLLHIRILARKIGIFARQLGYPLDSEETPRADVLQYLWRLPANIFVQLLAVTQLSKGLIGSVSRLIAWISLIVGPVLLLLLIQIRFLPFHSWEVTWLHRGLVLLDLILLSTLWPFAVSAEKEMRWRNGAFRGWLAASCAALFVSVILATFPGEWLDAKLDFEWIPPNWFTASLGAHDEQDQPIWTSLHNILFIGPYDERRQRRLSFFSNTLVLPNFNASDTIAADESTSESTKHTIVRKRGHFEEAVFRGADLRKINFENAHLEGANFYQAKLQDAQMYNASLEDANFYQAKLQRASFGEARLGRANFQGADLDGAFLFKASLQGATLEGAKLGGATFREAKLEGATLDRADAPGANFEKADLRGARLRGVHPQPSNKAELLQSPTFRAASFREAQLQGACLDNAQLAGADFASAKLTLARLNNASVWGANFVGADLDRMLAASPSRAEPERVDYDKLRARFAGSDDALKRLDKWLNTTAPESTPDSPFESLPSTQKMSEEDQAAEQLALADQLAGLVCSARDEDVSDIVRGLIRDDHGDSIIRQTGLKARGLIDRILGLNCQASAYLTGEDKEALKAFSEKLAAVETPPL